jgi:hypothetical protein
MNRFSSTILALVATVGWACEAPESIPADRPQAPGTPPPQRTFRGRVYERSFVFTTLTGDSTLLVPWLLSTRTRPGGTDRRARGWLVRGGTWEAFYDEQWESPRTRAPWRVLPHGALRLIVGEGDAVESLVFSQGPRQLELELSAPLIEWAGARGQMFRILDAAVHLADQRVGGVALDMARVHGTDAETPGDWAFLTSGDSLQAVLERELAQSTDSTESYRAWARLDSRDLQWPSLSVEWTELRAFQPARQDVPVSWSLTTAGGAVEGTLDVESAHVQAGEGEGPLLPVDALFLVSGTLRIEGASYPVHGLFRHTRP